MIIKVVSKLKSFFLSFLICSLFTKKFMVFMKNLTRKTKIKVLKCPMRSKKAEWGKSQSEILEIIVCIKNFDTFVVVSKCILINV